jgi:hypothetical protein
VWRSGFSGNERGERKITKKEKKGKQESELETWRMMRSSTEEDLSNCCGYSSENIPSYIKSCCSFLSSSVASPCNLLFSSLLFSSAAFLIWSLKFFLLDHLNLLFWDRSVGAENWVCGIVCVGGLGVWDFLSRTSRGTELLVHLQEMKKSGDQIRHGLIWVFLGFGFECSLFSSHPGSFCLTDRQSDRQSPGQRAGLFREHDFLLVFTFCCTCFLPIMHCCLLLICHLQYHPIG